MFNRAEPTSDESADEGGWHQRQVWRARGWITCGADIVDGKCSHCGHRSASSSAPGSCPDRAAAAREVEALLRRVSATFPTEDSEEVGYLYVSRGDGYADGFDLPAFAALVVDAALGQEET